MTRRRWRKRCSRYWVGTPLQIQWRREVLQVSPRLENPRDVGHPHSSFLLDVFHRQQRTVIAARGFDCASDDRRKTIAVFRILRHQPADDSHVVAERLAGIGNTWRLVLHL